MMGHCLDAQCNFAHSVDELKIRPKRSISIPPQVDGGAGFDQDTFATNTEFCARTILSMLIRMQPEAAVAFLSNPECKVMLERLLEDKQTSPSMDEFDGSSGMCGLFSTPTSTSAGSLTPEPASRSYSFDVHSRLTH